jgi:hypothetical protein
MDDFIFQVIDFEKIESFMHTNPLGQECNSKDIDSSYLQDNNSKEWQGSKRAIPS